ncbi:AAA family ATPase [Sulfoacidibacillus thermotolerans]|uniref:AAA domain-containing protein n=1 Tax=Sulfoacidibacillus thermotolerans TaxID=1765684 RepID=A0A2U3DCS8_SULT2|nr:AAA family ATPase [Sulfoacidibacillus thermotolerans]PWI59087.1 hypothetical protein BM613_00325 [Sulfoacidibacillus thermotolerans]
MFTVYVAIRAQLQPQLVTAVKQIPHAVFIGSSVHLRQALEECAVEHPDVLLVDDHLLVEDIQLVDQITSISYPIVFFASSLDTEAISRALIIHAQDFLDMDNWTVELSATLSRAAVSIQRDPTKEGRVFVVFSSKGGVGKTTLSVNLAIALAKKYRQPVAILDLDVQFGDAAFLVGDTPEMTLYDVIKETTTVNEATISHALKEVTEQVYLLAAPNNPEEAEDITADHVVQILRWLRKRHAFVVVDTTPGYTDINLAAFDFSDAILTICTPDVMTLRTVVQALQVFYNGFHYTKEKIRIVLNRSGSKTGVETSDITRVLQTPISFQLPSDGSYPVEAANEGKPLLLKFPESVLSRSIQYMANELIQEIEGQNQTEKNKGQSKHPFISKIISKFHK